MKIYQRSTRRGFTLVELLIAILIIAILAAILLPGIGAARRKAMNFSINSELNGLSSALESFKADYQDYPPDFEELDRNRVFPNGPPPFSRTHASRFIRKNFARISGSDLSAMTVRAPAIDNAEALVLWLRGVSNDPQNPFTGPGGPLNTSDRRQPRFDFQADRLGDRDGDGFLEYYPPYPSIEKALPYCYFNNNNYSFTFVDSSSARQYGYAEHNSSQLWRYDSSQSPPYVAVSMTDNGVARPLRSTEPILASNRDASDPHVAKGFYFAEREKFQILACGLDAHFGQGSGFFPTGEGLGAAFPGYIREDRDNLTSFSGKTLREALP